MSKRPEFNVWDVVEVLEEMGWSHLNSDKDNQLKLWSPQEYPTYLPSDRPILSGELDYFLRINEINTEEFWARYEEHHT